MDEKDKEQEFQKTLEAHLKEQFQAHFISGTRAGYDSSVLVMEENISKMRTAKEIKAYVKKCANDVRTRLNMQIDEVEGDA